MMRRSCITIVLTGATLLAGCVDAAKPVSPPTGSILVDPSVGPGPSPATPKQAGVLFAQICIATLPNFEGAAAKLSAPPFKQNSTTGTYYHQQINLSFKLMKEDGKPVCSLVYGAKSAITPGVTAFANAVIATRDAEANVVLGANPGPDNLTYFHAKALAN